MANDKPIAAWAAATNGVIKDLLTVAQIKSDPEDKADLEAISAHLKRITERNNDHAS